MIGMKMIDKDVVDEIGKEREIIEWMIARKIL